MWHVYVPVAQGKRPDGGLMWVADIDRVRCVGPELEADGLVGVQAQLHVALFRLDCGRHAYLCSAGRQQPRHNEGDQGDVVHDAGEILRRAGTEEDRGRAGGRMLQCSLLNGRVCFTIHVYYCNATICPPN